MKPSTGLTRISGALMIDIPIQIFTSLFFRNFAAQDEPTGLILTPLHGINAEEPALKDQSPEIASLPNRREWLERKDEAMDVDDKTSTNPQVCPAANPTTTNEPAISNAAALGHEPEQPSNSSPLSHGAAAPTSAHMPADPQLKSSTTPKIKPRSVHARRRSRSHIPQKDGHRAERSSDGCSWARLKRRLREAQDPRGIVPEPEELSGPKLLTPWTPRPRYDRTSGSMARPWGLKQPSGLRI